MNTAPFVRLPRGFESEDWWCAVPLAARCLSVLLIGQASFKREKCRGVWVEPGQLVSTQRELAEASGATRSQVRSAIAALERVGFLKAKKASDEKKAPTLFSIVEWQRFIHPDKSWREGKKKRCGSRKSDECGTPKESPKESPNAKPATMGVFSVSLPKESPSESPTREISRERTEHSELYRAKENGRAAEAAKSVSASAKSGEGFVSHPSDGPLPKESEAAAQAGSASPLHITNRQQTLAIRQASALHALQKAAAEVGFVSGDSTGSAAWDGPVLVAAPTAPPPRSSSGGLDAGDFAAMAAAMLGQAGGAS